MRGKYCLECCPVDQLPAESVTAATTNEPVSNTERTEPVTLDAFPAADELAGDFELAVDELCTTPVGWFTIGPFGEVKKVP